MALEKMPGGAAFARKYEVRFHQPLQVYAPFAYVAQRDKIIVEVANIVHVGNIAMPRDKRSGRMVGHQLLQRLDRDNCSSGGA